VYRRIQFLCSIYEVGSQQLKIELEEENWGGYDPNTVQRGEREICFCHNFYMQVQYFSLLSKYCCLIIFTLGSGDNCTSLLYSFSSVTLICTVTVYSW
jgi:hypothetical protein